MQHVDDDYFHEIDITVVEGEIRGLHSIALGKLSDCSQRSSDEHCLTAEHVPLNQMGKG